MFVFLISFFLLPTLGASTTPIGTPCAQPKVQAQRSRELQQIREADQADRAWQLKGMQPTPKILEKMLKNDLLRRKRVGEIFGEGCFQSAEDYEAAFLIYQHGTTSDHYFQAFLWSKRALELGKTQIKGEMAMAVDRYLVSIGHKQLFGTQAFRSGSNVCWCLQPIEESFPQKLREEYRGGESAAYTGLAYLKILNAAQNCPAPFCESKLRPSPQGTLPGFW